MQTAIQCVTECGGAREAYQMVLHYLTQDGCIGGRIIGDGCCKPYAAQAFFSTDKRFDELGAEGADDWLPDGCRYVLLPQAVRATLTVPTVAV